MLEEGSNAEIVAQSLETVTSAVRKTIRSELKSTENRLAKLSAKATKFAGATIYLTESFRVASADNQKITSAGSAVRIKEAMAWGARQLIRKEEDDNNGE